ncbi:SEC-C domain-containing protein [Bacillus pseudomycoides]|uniref:SEC-C domain-containing protein n=1 Tax=Bacillus pseudomycoides TaxID=64104 RepID=A0AAJ1Z3C2_9BACI|nr:SEC-C domain-containing protein [Bacillus pseudomycoides]MDR4328322.1 SEC-C domain-containing protein [Bacillus pseudomycoides]PEK68656.1 nucleic acid-binding protein [Bacillus pseudomycoides]PFY52320.1 nucleic acid-binding protein [Bacillus pseudomycoides]PGE25295.1 nucleic acid-binding protein [Bacillus pseudomycoides]
MYERNELCPCGSEKKFKKCCINIIKSHEDVWKQRAIRLSSEINSNQKLVNTYFAVLNHAMKNNWIGACHTISSILYVLLKEQGFNSKLEIGFVTSSKIPKEFCHSWITLDSYIYDVGLYRANDPFQPSPFSYLELSNPIFKGVDIESLNEPNVSFGVASNLESLDNNFKKIVNMSLGRYMDASPVGEYGLWEEVLEIAKEIGLKLVIEDIREKYYEDRFMRVIMSS